MRVLVTGASGQLGSYLLREMHQRNLPVIAWCGSRGGSLFRTQLAPVNLTERDAVVSAFRQARPTVILHTAAMARVSDCHRDPKLAQRTNTDATALLAELAAEAKAKLIYVSTDLVFNGDRGNYCEHDTPRPLSIYGETKAAGERVVLTYPNHLVVRLSLLFGPSLNGRKSFFDEQGVALQEGRPITLFRDEWRTPLSLTTASSALLEIAKSDVKGVLHLGGPERLSRVEMGQRLAAFLGIPSPAIEAKDRADIPAPEPRPRDTSLDSGHWSALFSERNSPTFEASLRDIR
jgi:dTDP-4-dehydrorhamnose reductase